MSATNPALRTRLLAEFSASAFLLIAVVGSGIMADGLSGGNIGLALLANAVATGAALYALILVFGPVPGAHMNPAVTISAAWAGEIERRHILPYIAAQITGAIVGVWLTHAMFDHTILEWGTKVRTGPAQWLAETIATIGLLGVIWGCKRYDTPTTASAVAAYITGAYWFTASTSFANPAVTIARAFTDSFAGIRPEDVLGFIAAQMIAVVAIRIAVAAQK
ncbi:MAG: aquaporin family protein [Rhodospirillaceae bacterium]|nr:aquaporin family protein [Rhodospirillaceae bacterium]